ncbi:flagellar motor switch protein FliN [Thalassiella azotivora]
MTAQPVETTGLSPQEARALSVAAATAAAPTIPSPHPLEVGAESSAAPAAGTPVFVATFTGTASGEVVLVLDDAVTSALTDEALGVTVEDAVKPALEAAAATLGPCVLGPVRSAGTEEVAGTSLVALVGGGSALAWVGVTQRSAQGTPSVPRQKASAGAAAPSAAPAPGAVAVNSLGLQLLKNVEMTLSVEIGRARMTVRDLLNLEPGSVVELDRAAGAPADLLVNGRLIARGEVVVVDEDFGLRITELVQPSGEGSA